MLKSKKIISLFMLVFLLLSLVPAMNVSAAYNLVWSDEFDGTSLNTSNWAYEVGGGGWGNNELEYYTNRTNNVAVTGGNLVITAIKESYGGMNYTSGRIKTQGLKDFTYGKIEARMKMSTGQGIWPAFWMLGSNIPTVNWPACGEIDIMEHINNETVVHGTIHWDYNGYTYYGGPSPSIDVTQFHVYSVEWTTTAIKWFVDGTQYWEANIANGINGTDEFQRPFFIILNLAVGGNWPGSPDGSTVFPASMTVDYVRVYQDNGAPTPTPTPAATPTPPPAGSNLALGKTMTASSYTQTYVAANANDGNVNTYWEGAANTYPNTLTVDLGSSQSIAKVNAKLASTWGSRTQTFSISGSTDNVTYSTIVNSNTYTFDPASSNVVTIPFTSTSKRYVRLNFTANSGATAGQVAEFEVYAPSGATPTPTNTPAATPTPTNTPVATPTPTNTPVATPTPTNTPAATPTPTATPVPGKYEAENAALSGGAKVNTDHTGFSGTGFVDGYLAVGASTTFTVNASAAGNYSASLRYANSMGSSRTLSIYVNGTKIKQTTLANLANWDTWANQVEALTLNAGNNTIAYKYDSTDNGNVNLDYINITQGTATPTPTPTPTPVSNLALGKAITASSVQQTYVATNANDGNATTYWEGAPNTYPNVLTVDLGSTKTVSKVVLKLNPDSAWSTRTQTLSILGSTDNVTYTSIVGSTVYTFNPATGNTVTITFTGAGRRYVRLNITANSGSTGGQISEFEVY
jgi:beta-glucanase (GH16 family)